MSQEGFQRCCRLCAKEQEVTVMIFSAEAEAMFLVNKLNKYLLIEVDEDDKLPKNICLNCCSKLQTVCDFIDSVHTAQEKLLKQSLQLENITKSNFEEIESKQITADEITFDSNTVEELKVEVETDCDDDDDDNESSEMEISVDPMVILQNSESAVSSNEDSQTATESFDYGEHVTIKLIKKADASESSPPVDSTNKPFQCLTCDRGFFSELALKNHSWSHKKEKKKIYKCNGCSESYNNKKKFLEHLKEHKSEGMCQLCGRMFRTETTLQNHMILHQSLNKTYTCKVCSRSYNTLSTLKTHSITHSNERPFHCHMCKKSFKRKQDLKFHINQHIGAKPYKCPFCDKAFASSGNCYSHRSRMHPGRHVDSVKGRIQRKKPSKQVPAKDVLLSSKSPLVPINGIFKYQCQLCDHSFMKKDNFAYHMYQHTGEKPFQCNSCSEQFLTKRGLLIHHNNVHAEVKRSLAYMTKGLLLL